MRLADLGAHHPAVRASARPEHAAAILHRPLRVDDGSGDDVLTFAQLSSRSAQLARGLAAHGVRGGEHVVILCSNRLEIFVACWAALRSGLYITPISTWLTAPEAAYIAADAGAVALIASSDLCELGAVVAERARIRVPIAVGGEIPGFLGWEEVLAGESAALLDDEPEGSVMFYSSGTTGRPKGVRKPLSGRVAGSSNSLTPFIPLVGIGPDTVYLSPAPLYHAAPLGWSLGTQRLGGTAVLLDKFDPIAVLGAVERHRVTLMQLVPTMLQRLLRVPATVRDTFDLSSLRKLVHAAAPCPPSVKEQAIDWLGPIVDEYYSGTEGSGITYISSPEWLTHVGSVGRPILGQVHITDEGGAPAAVGESGVIWFAGGERYEYHGDPAATSARRNREGWTTLDDVGFLDADGYLYLTDRRAHMIVCGGVNISPREIEDVLSGHPDVDDVAVIGVPDADLGEVVKAVVMPLGGVAAARPELTESLTAHCRQHLASYKCPRSFDYVDVLPRMPTGKLATRLLRDTYWADHATRIL